MDRIEKTVSLRNIESHKDCGKKQHVPLALSGHIYIDNEKVFKGYKNR